MALEFIYIAIIIAGIFLALGLIYQDHLLMTIAGFFIMILGIFIFTDGVASLNNFVTEALSVIFIAVGGYFTITQGIRFIQEGLGEA